jgi:hypothetical protein
LYKTTEARLRSLNPDISTRARVLAGTALFVDG